MENAALSACMCHKRIPTTIDPLSIAHLTFPTTVLNSHNHANSLPKYSSARVSEPAQPTPPTGFCLETQIHANFDCRTKATSVCSQGVSFSHHSSASSGSKKL